MDNNIGSAREQFENEAIEIRKIIYDLIGGGNIEAAEQVLDQYIKLNPIDPEIKVMREMTGTGDKKEKEKAPQLPDGYGILKNIETIFVLAGIIFKRVGSIDSALRKIKLMEDKWGYKPLVLTCVHNIENRQARMWLSTAGDNQVTINAGTRMLNVYEYFQKSYADGLENKAVYTRADDGMRYVEKEDKVYRVYDGDTLIREEFYDGYAGSLRMVSYYENGKRVSDSIYDDWGYLNYIREYDRKNESLLVEKYYTTGGKLCIESIYKDSYEEDENPISKLLVYNENGSIAGEYSDSAELASLCLEQIMTDDKFYVFIVEDGLMAKAVTFIDKDKKNLAKCEIVHNIFLNDAYDLSSKPQRFYKYLCENHEKFDGIIMLTDDSRKDFQKLYGKSSDIFVIPHPYPYEISRVDFNNRDTKKAVIVSRLNRVKLIDYSVDIFALVVKEVPEARLEIYGRGEEEGNLKAQIKRLGLENNVFLMGYTDDPLNVFRTAALSMMTSWAEGFGMTLMESICNGCPAFAFDIKYGPSEIIIDGQTGFLVPRFDKKLFADKMIRYFKDENKQRQMSGNCYADVSRFSTDKFLENWFNMTKTLYEQHISSHT
jgi:poly(glycerol-phosphate) alpha-glucosyltransferase